MTPSGIEPATFRLVAQCCVPPKMIITKQVFGLFCNPLPRPKKGDTRPHCELVNNTGTLKQPTNAYLGVSICRITCFLLLLPLALLPTVGLGLSNNVLPFFPIRHKLSPSSHSQHLKISFYFLFPSFPGSSPSSRPVQFLSEDLFGHPILLHSL